MDWFTSRGGEAETRDILSDGSSSGISFELSCFAGRSKSYDMPPISSPCVNGHINRTVVEED